MGIHVTKASAVCWWERTSCSSFDYHVCIVPQHNKQPSLQNTRSRQCMLSFSYNYSWFLYHLSDANAEKVAWNRHCIATPQLQHRYLRHIRDSVLAVSCMPLSSGSRGYSPCLSCMHSSYCQTFVMPQLAKKQQLMQDNYQNKADSKTLQETLKVSGCHE